MAYGSAEQKARVAGHVLVGDKPAICITEPGAGSDAGAMTTTATRDGETWVLNGVKHWITGGGVSRVHLIFARIVEDGGPRGVGAFLAVRGEDAGLRIPAAMALIPHGDPAQGFKRLMTAYNAQRVGAAAVALGLAQGAFELARDFLLQRQQFGRPLAEFQGLQWMLADMSIAIEAARALVVRAAESAGAEGFPDMAMVAQAKILAAETAVKVTGDALQMHGAAGYSRDLPLERMARDARMFTIGGGTAQVLRNQLAGAILGIKNGQRRR